MVMLATIQGERVELSGVAFDGGRGCRIVEALPDGGACEYTFHECSGWAVGLLGEPVPGAIPADRVPTAIAALAWNLLVG